MQFPTPTEVVPLGVVIEMGKLWAPWEGQWVRIKPHRSYAAKARLDGVRHELTVKTNDRETMNLAVKSIEYAVAMVEECVLEWRLLDVNGQLIPASRKGITGDDVPSDLIDQVVGEVSDYYEAQRPKVFRESEKSD